MNSRRYVICDIEATGLHNEREIIEIALITLEDDKIIDIYETLVNPLKHLSDYIQDLTNISSRELQKAPKFYDVADAIRTRLEGNIFVSHNTDFDYNLLRKKYQEMGQDLKLKTFCTLKVAQSEIPGMRSYNLDALCNFFHIKISDRHRAIGDAKATLELFKELRDLHFKNYLKVLFLPQHEKLIKKLPLRPGLISFKDNEGNLIHVEAAQNMFQKAEELLKVKNENRKLLETVESIEGEITGSLLIAEFKKLSFNPFNPHWAIVILTSKEGEKIFKIRPHKKGQNGIWFFKEYFEAKKKLKELENNLQDKRYVYQEGGRSKLDIIERNRKAELLVKEASFPSEHILILGEGRTVQEKSFILIRNSHVRGYGYSEASEEEISHTPEKFLIKRYSQHLGADLAAKRYIRILKNMKNKTDGWRSLSEAR